MQFDDLLAYSKANSSSLIIIPVVKALEQYEDLMLVLWIDADAIVRDGEAPFSSIIFV